MKRLARFVFRTSKGIYDIFATYLLAFILPFSIAAFAFHLGFGSLAGLLGFESVDQLWNRAAEWSPISTVWMRIGLFLPLHIVTWRLLRGPVAAAWPHFERLFDKLVAAFRWVTERAPALQVVGEWLFSLTVTALLIPFVIQPTLVPDYTDPDAWLERVANLVDGTATSEIAESVVGLYRKLYADPVVTAGVPREDQKVFAESPDDDVAAGPIVAPKPNGQQPLMDRWDPWIEDVANGDPEQFAYVKAFMWVESGGRQYAVSRTGCSGLMQFCVGTAKSPPFDKIFGTGTVYRCNCRDDRCRFSREMQRDLESGDPEALKRHKKQFPCEMTDARFNPDKIIGAGSLYVENLRKRYGGNIYLMYIGYNSGPRVADAVYEKVGENPDATLDEIGEHLATCLEPNFGSSANSRARGLVGTHLPKLADAYQKYYEPPRLAEHSSLK